MPTTPRIQGTVAPGFEPVRRAFHDNFLYRGEVGAGLCVYRDGEKVVDLWGGTADRKKGRQWTADTPAVLFSATKGLAAMALLKLVDAGRLELDAPVSRYWPAFGADDKRDITVRMLINHRSGLVAIEQPLTIDDFANHPERVVAALEQQAPLWEPGTQQGYHAVSYGPYVGELFRRVAGEPLKTFFRRELSLPLGADAWIGLPDQGPPQVSTLYPSGLGTVLGRVVPEVLLGDSLETRVLGAGLLDKESYAHRALANPAELGALGLKNVNRMDVLRLELPWMGGVASARAVATLYAPLAHGGEWAGKRWFRTESIEPLKARQSWQTRDNVLHKPVGWSQGFIKEELHLFSPNPQMFGHPGAGGALGFADPKARLSFGYVLNKMHWRIRSPRALALCHAVYGCL